MPVKKRASSNLPAQRKKKSTPTKAGSSTGSSNAESSNAGSTFYSEASFPQDYENERRVRTKLNYCGKDPESTEEGGQYGLLRVTVRAGTRMGKVKGVLKQINAYKTRYVIYKKVDNIVHTTKQSAVKAISEYRKKTKYIGKILRIAKGCGGRMKYYVVGDVTKPQTKAETINSLTQIIGTAEVVQQ